MRDKCPNRRRFLQAVGAVGAMGLAGCTGGGGSGESDSEYLNLEQLADQYYLEGERVVIVHPDVMESLEVESGMQIRVGQAGGSGIGSDAALFTLRHEHPIEPDRENIYLAERDLDRFDAADGEEGIIAEFGPHPDIEERSEAESNQEFIDLIVDNGSHHIIAAVAPHGGDIEPYTDNQAERIADRMGITSWMAAGYDNDGTNRAHERWFVPETNIHPMSFGRLEELEMRGFDAAVSFHSFHGDERGEHEGRVSIGGLLSEDDRSVIQDKIREYLDSAGADARVTMEPTGAGHGTSSDNVVNWLTEDGRSGVEIKQSPDIREDYWMDVADAVQDALEDLFEEEYEDEGGW